MRSFSRHRDGPCLVPVQPYGVIWRETSINLRGGKIVSHCGTMKARGAAVTCVELYNTSDGWYRSIFSNLKQRLG